jgi:hypothetical protein
MNAVAQRVEEVTLQFSEPQYEFLSATEKYVAAVAGFGSGKTFVGLARILKNMMEAPGIDQAYLAPTYPLIRDIFYQTVGEALPILGLDYKINKSEHIVSIPDLGSIYCRTMDNPENIVGWKVADAILDEFDVLPTNKAIHVFRKVSARLRQKNPTGRINQLFITTTPEGFKATYQLFKKSPLANSRLIQMSTYSNAHNLPDDYIEELMNQYPEELIKAYLLGQFVNLVSGVVYGSYNREMHRSCEDIKVGDVLYIGQDFNVGNMASTIYVIRDGIWHAVGELTKIFDTPALIDTLKQKFPGNKIVIYPDASGDSRKTVDASKSDISLLKNAGFTVKANSKNPFVKDRVLAVNAAFTHGKVLVNDTLCPTVASNLEQQVYNQNGEPDKSAGVDHQNDATGYPIVYEMPIRKPIIINTGIISAV